MSVSVSQRQLESSLSIPCYEGSMISVRNPSAFNSEKSSASLQKPNVTSKPSITKINVVNWKSEHLNPDFECAKCDSHLKNPVLLKECEHNVCSVCLYDLLKNSPFCPSCKTSIAKENTVLNKVLQKRINELGVYCSFKSNGCTWESNFKSLSTHLETCAFVEIDCPKGCGQKYMKKNEQAHFEDDCIQVETQCEFCNTSITKADEFNHLNVCKEFIVPCPNACGKTEMRRADVQSHLENDCPKHEINCPFCDSGCTFKSLKSDMVKHIKESPGIHLNFMSKTLSSQKKQITLLSEIIEKQKVTIDGLVSKMASVDRFNCSQLIWKIDNFEEKFNDSQSGKKVTIFSPPFLTHPNGYKLAISTSLYGDGKAKGKYMSLFVCVCKGDFDGLLKWPFSNKITLTLIDQNSDPTCEKRDIVHTIKPNPCKENKAFLGRPIADKNSPFGTQKFIDLETLKSLYYVVDNAIFIKVDIDYHDLFN